MREVVTNLEVFIASPGDVAQERDRARQVILQVDQKYARQLGFALQAVGWEDIRPGVGHDAQEVVNRQIEPRDVFVGIMWSRVGTRTGRAESGTIEEFEKALSGFRNGTLREVWLYFCTRDIPREQTGQVQQVLEFERKAQSEGCLTFQYNDVGEFGELLADHLRSFVGTLEDESATSGPEPAPGNAVESRDPRRSPEDVLADLETRARYWIRSDPLLWPDFSGGDVLCREVNDLGAPASLSREATLLMLMLSIQQGTRWWIWYRRAEGLAEVPSILSLAVGAIRHPWVRVAVRGAYLLQCLSRDGGLETQGEAPASPTSEEADLLEAARAGRVTDWVRDRMQRASDVDIGKLASLIRELGRADSYLGCEKQREDGAF